MTSHSGLRWWNRCLLLVYEAEGYASAEEYIGAAGGRSFNCVVTDIHMAGMSGLDLAKHLATQGLSAGVVLITARSERNLEARAAAAGAACVLRKPFEINELVKCIEGAAKG